MEGAVGSAHAGRLLGLPPFLPAISSSLPLGPRPHDSPELWRISGGFHLSLAVQTTDEPGQMLRNSFVQYGRVEAPQHHADRIDHHARIGVRDARSARRDNLHGWLPLRIEATVHPKVRFSVAAHLGSGTWSRSAEISHSAAPGRRASRVQKPRLFPASEPPGRARHAPIARISTSLQKGLALTAEESVAVVARPIEPRRETKGKEALPT